MGQRTQDADSFAVAFAGVNMTALPSETVAMFVLFVLRPAWTGRAEVIRHHNKRSCSSEAVKLLDDRASWYSLNGEIFWFDG